MAAKLWSTFFVAHGDALEFLRLAEQVFNEVTPFIDVAVDVDRQLASRHLRDDDFRAARVEVVDDPVCVERLVGDQAIELDAADKRGDAGRVMPLAWQQHEADEIAERIAQRQDFGRQTPFGTANGLILSPPLRPGRAGEP